MAEQPKKSETPKFSPPKSGHDRQQEHSEKYRRDMATRSTLSRLRNRKSALK